MRQSGTVLTGAERFRLVAPGGRADRMRSIRTPEGIGDRLRSVAFAELQAREAFLWAADHLDDASEEVRRVWRALAQAEDKHLRWLLARLEEVGEPIDGRAVSDRLYLTLTSATNAEAFAAAMARAEDAGRESGERLEQSLATSDPVTGTLFGRIALEERDHVALAEHHFPTACLEALRREGYVAGERN